MFQRHTVCGVLHAFAFMNIEHEAVGKSGMRIRVEALQRPAGHTPDSSLSCDRHGPKHYKLIKGGNV